MVGAHVQTLNHFCKMFYLILSWLELVYGGHVVVLDGEPDTGRLVLYGEPEMCTKFQTECTNILNSLEDPEEEWRRY